MDLNKWYKEGFESLKETPSPEAWENISSALDQERDTGIMPVIKRYGLVLLLLLFSAPAAWYFTDDDTIETSTENRFIAEKPDKFNAADPSSNSENRDSNNKISKEEDNSRTEKATDNLTLKSEKPKAKRKVTDPIESKDGESLTTMRIKEGSKPTTGIEEINHMEKSKLIAMSLRFPEFKRPENFLVNRPIENTDPIRKNSRSFFVGLSGTVNNLYLLNHDTWEGFDAKSLSTVVPDFGSDFGLVAGVNLSETKAVQTEISKIQRGQRYKRYSEGNHVKENITLDYYQLALLYKKKTPKYAFNGRLPITLNWYGGPYIAMLKEVDHKMGTTATTALENQFLNYDAGFDLGVEYGINFNSGLSLNAGVRTSTSLVNIYKGNGKIPRDFNRTRNFAIGVNLGVQYNISR